MKEFEETYRQIEEDCDQEILDLKWKYETILKRERDANFRLKAESGLIRLVVGGSEDGGMEKWNEQGSGKKGWKWKK